MLVSLDLILILIFLSWKVIHSFWVSFMLLHLHLIFNSKFHLFFKLIQFSIFLFFQRERVSPPRGDALGLTVVTVKSEGEVCQGCGLIIQDRYLLRVNSKSWHQACLRCCVCQLALDRQPSCFIRDHNIYCRSDYAR